jgi:hypothetical protein
MSKWYPYGTGTSEVRLYLSPILNIYFVLANTPRHFRQQPSSRYLTSLLYQYGTSTGSRTLAPLLDSSLANYYCILTKLRASAIWTL